MKLEEKICSQKRNEESPVEMTVRNSELEEFVHTVSHDLKAPLRIIAGYLQEFKNRHEKKCDDETRHMIDRMLSNILFANSMIEDLSAYALIGKKETPFSVVSCSAVMRIVLAHFSEEIRECGAVVECGFLPEVRSAENELLLLFENLIGNAIKFRGKNLPDICVSAQKKGNRWLFSVRDNGIGIDSRYHECIFNIFRRLHTKDAYPGTGAGLTICKKIVERYHGKIWVESQLNEGSIFYFTLPDESENSWLQNER